MIYFVKVEIECTPYMNPSKKLDRFHTIEADSWDNADKKLTDFYEAKCEPNGDSWSVINANWAEHIQ